MRKLLIGLLLALGCLAQSVQAQTVNMWCYTGPNNPQWQPCSPGNPLSQRSGEYGVSPSAAPQYCQITTLSSAVGLVTASCSTGTVLSTATIAEICVSTQGIRYTSSGVVTPTASIGIPVAAGACFQYAGPISTLKMIQQTSGAVVDVETFP